MEDLSKYTPFSLWAVRNEVGEVVQSACTENSEDFLIFRADRDRTSAFFDKKDAAGNFGEVLMPWSEWEKRLPDAEEYVAIWPDGQISQSDNRLKKVRASHPSAIGFLKITIKDGKPSIGEVKDA